MMRYIDDCTFINRRTGIRETIDEVQAIDSFEYMKYFVPIIMICDENKREISPTKSADRKLIGRFSNKIIRTNSNK